MAFELPAPENDERSSNWLFAVTAEGAVRWYDLSCPQYSPQQWQQLIAARTGMQLDDQGEPTFIPHDEWLTVFNEAKQLPR